MNTNKISQRQSPFLYYRNLHPELFSDTTEHYEIPLTQEIFDLQLELLSTKKMQSEFENFIVSIAKRNITPNIKPQTGPDGGGDGKVDAETYEVSNDISDKWYSSSEETAAGKEYWAFAISCKKNWKPKVSSDVEKIVGTNRGYTKAIFFTNQYIKSSTRAEVEESLTNKYRIKVKIIDATTISKWVFQDGGKDIALTTLNFSDEFKRKTVQIGPNDKNRQKRLLEIENSIIRHVDGLDTQYVDEVHETCILCRGLERPKTEIENHFKRAIRECQKHGSKQQLFNIIYDHAWTNFFWFEDVDTMYEDFLTLKTLLEEHCNVARVEKLSNLMTNLSNAARAGYFNSNCIITELQFITNLQKKLDKDPDKSSSALYLAIYIQENQIINDLFQGNYSIEDKLQALKPLLIKSASHLEISIESQYKIIEIISRLLPENDLLDKLTDELAEIIAEKRSKSEAAKVRLSRAKDLMEKKKWASAIKQLGFCVYAFEQENCMSELVQSSGIMGVALKNIGLLYSAEAYLVKSASYIIQDFFHSGKIHHLLVTILQHLCTIELKLGRLVMFLNWHELLSVIANNAEFNKKEDYKKNCDMEDAAWACRFSVSNLKEKGISMLPDILERNGLFYSSEFLKYALGYHEDVDENYLTNIRNIYESSKLKDQPVFDQFVDKLNISTQGKAYVKTTVNNFTFTICYENNLKVQRIAELFLASIESFMATSDLFEIVPVTSHIIIKISQTKEKSDLVYDNDTNDYKFNLNLDHCDYEAWWNCFLEFLTYFFSKNAMSQESIYEIIEKKQNGERLMDRISILQRTEMALNNILGTSYKYTIEDWSRKTDKTYNYKREINSFEEKSYNNDKQNTMVTYNINSDINLWDNAKWKGCLFMFDQMFKEPAIFGLAFLNNNLGKQLVDEWKSTFNVKIIIIKGINKQHPTWYRVCVMPTIPTKEPHNQRYLSIMQRCHTMTPDTNENLNKFETQYNQFGGCWLMSVSIKEDNSFEIPSSFEDAFKFTNIEFREAYLINSKDIARFALLQNDIPFIPEDRKNDAPVLNVLKEMKSIIKSNQ